MKSSGPAVARYASKNELVALIRQVIPTVVATGFHLVPISGLSSENWRICTSQGDWLARPQLLAGLQIGTDRQREFVILRQMAAHGLSPRPLCWQQGWLIIEWLSGHIATQETFIDAVNDGSLAVSLARLHQQAGYGFPLDLKTRFVRHWQLMDPGRRSPTLLKRHQMFQHRRLPEGGIFAPLHLDIHAGNLLQKQDQWWFIDWEYAADGDIALEVAGLFRANDLNEASQQRFLDAYCHQWPGLCPDVLGHRVYQWLPWVDFMILMWYEVRWQQTHQKSFLQAADAMRLRLGITP
ncbi:phosphotransferase [Prodigiosinella aquatilis]|nr:phosphotransferase [Prodigiosinella sp. LS101]WJV52104.1 phosphotransferase [Prodigiosinella sp. LS101]WJV56462.1 phosphotransferase [Pectobacteriaceae bacterium C111]